MSIISYQNSRNREMGKKNGKISISYTLCSFSCLVFSPCKEEEEN